MGSPQGMLMVTVPGFIFAVTELWWHVNLNNILYKYNGKLPEIQHSCNMHTCNNTSLNVHLLQSLIYVYINATMK